MSFDYLDFDIRIGALGEGGYTVAVRSPVGETHTVADLQPVLADLPDHLRGLNMAVTRSARETVQKQGVQSLRAFGETLFRALLDGEAGHLYTASQNEARHCGQGLRVRLMVAAPEVALIPWELLYDPRTAEYVCLSRNTPVVRYLEMPQPMRSLSVSPPLKVLGVAVSPPELAPVNLAREKGQLEQALARLHNQVTLTWLQGNTWQDLMGALRSGSWHLMHFMGHGGFDPWANEGFLMLADEDGHGRPFSATQLARLLGDHATLRLVLLNACAGARGSGEDVFTSTATTLVRRGIPAAVAMQYEISDLAAIEFSRTFYGALADGLPVDTAVVEARKAISLSVPDTLEWGTPVLYLRAPDGRIIDFSPVADAGAEADPQERPSERHDQREGAMDVTAIVAAALALLVPYLTAAGAGAAGKAGEAMLDKALNVHKAIRARIDASEDDYPKQALQRFEQQPAKRRAALAEVLEEILNEDPAFAQSLADLVADASRAAGGTVFNTQIVDSQVGEIYNIDTISGDLTINRGK